MKVTQKDILAVHVKTQSESLELQQFLFLRDYGWTSYLHRTIQEEPNNVYGPNTCIYFRDFIGEDSSSKKQDKRRLNYTFCEQAQRNGILLIPCNLSSVAEFIANGTVDSLIKNFENYNAYKGQIDTKIEKIKNANGEEETEPSEIL